MEICRIVNRNCVQAVNYGLSHDSDLAIVTARLGLSAWLDPENGEQCDQSEASIRVS